jgi:MFS family permease
VNRLEALAPLRAPNFRWYFASRFVNLVGSTMAAVALAFAVLEVSDSPSALGTVLAANSIPLVAFLLVGGVVADRFGRTLMIQAGNVVAGLSQLAIAFLVLGGHAKIWQLACLAGVIGTAQAMSMPAVASVMPALVPRAHLQQANVLVSMLRGALTIIGPSAAGLIVVTAGAGWAIVVDGITYLVAAALLLKVRIPSAVRDDDRTSVIVDLREGWTYFTRTTWLWVVVLAFLLINMIHAGALSTLGPVLAKGGDIGERGWGLILSAEAVGLLITTLVMIRLPLRRPLLVGMLGMALDGLLITMLGLEPHLGLLLVFAVFSGVGVELFSLGWNLAMQEHVPEDLLSRAYSYDALGSFVAIPIGQLLFGPLGAVFGVANVILIGGLAYIAIALLTLTSRAVRTLDRVRTTDSEPALTR